MDADFLIQAGHQGGVRNQGATGSTASWGTSGEPTLTPQVADAAAEILRAAGYSVIREDAFYDKKYDIKVSVALHFDGSGTPCASGASIGYPPGVPVGSNKPVADLWRNAYYPYFPFKTMKDNFTTNLSGYYGYNWTNTEVAEFLIEFGELTCPEQREWLKARVEDKYLAKMVAHVLEKAIGGDKIPHPGSWMLAPTPPPAPGYDDSEIKAQIATLTAAVSVANKNIAAASGRAESAHVRLDKLKDI